jgi:hypothetical protein
MSAGAPDIDAATAAAIAGETGRAARHALPVGAPCPNCAKPLQGPWCYACGQKAEDYHRSIWRLAAEALEGVTDFDGRFWHTVPRLLFRPGQLTRDYLAGHRAAQVPPFRMYLVTVIILLFAWGASQQATGKHFHLASKTQTAAVAARTKMEALRGRPVSAVVAHPNAVQAWLLGRTARIRANPEGFFGAMERWAEISGVLMLPMAALLLALLFAFRKGVFIFDHLIFSMHALSFLSLLLSAVLLLGMATGSSAWLLLAAPVHLFVHLRGAYRTGVAATLLRTVLLIVGLALSFVLVLIGLVLVALALTP